jgi:hypothetical protein
MQCISMSTTTNNNTNTTISAQGLLAPACHHIQAEAQAALAAAEAERNNRAEAQGMSEALRQESERRARVFNNAVKAAVSKVQKDLQVGGCGAAVGLLTEARAGPSVLLWCLCVPCCCNHVSVQGSMSHPALLLSLQPCCMTLLMQAALVVASTQQRYCTSPC